MVQILAPKHHPSFSEKLGLNNIGKQFGEGFTSGVELSLDRKDEMRQEAKKAKEAQVKAERDYENALNLKKYEYEQKKEIEGLKGQRKGDEADIKNRKELQEKIMPFQNGLETINEMRNLIKGGNLGLGSEFLSVLNPEARKDRAKYEQLGKSLISLASNIPIRNQKEFETLASNLYNPSNSDATNEGIMDAMESIITRSLQQFQLPNQQESQQENNMQAPQQERPDILSFHR